MGPGVAAVGAGLAVALAVSVPAALAAQVADAVTDGSPGWITYPLSLTVLAGAALGGRATARRCTTHPIALAAVTAFVAIAVIQILGVARRAAADRDIAWRTTPAVAALAVGLAVTAAALGTGRPGRTRP